LLYKVLYSDRALIPIAKTNQTVPTPAPVTVNKQSICSVESVSTAATR